MGVQEMALMLLGVGILSERFGGGRGLQELGTGVQTLIAAPLTGTGTGLTSFAGGLRALAESFGDIGRGISALLGGFPEWARPGYVGPGGSGSGQLPQPGASLPGNGNGLPPLIAMSTDGGGSSSTLLAGGGGNVTGASFSFVEPSAFIQEHYAVTPGYHAGLGVSGWWVANSPTNDSPAGGSVMA